MRSRSARLVLATCLLWLAGCGGAQEPRPFQPYVYERPPQLDDGWQSAVPEDVHMETGPLAAAAEELLNSEGHELHSLLVVRDGLLVFEAYFPGHAFCLSCRDYHAGIIDWNRSTPHNTHSATKSVTSTLVGIAIDRGLIGGVHERVVDYLPDYAYLMTGGKRNITLQHMLTMSAGLEWDERSAPGSGDNDMQRILGAADPVHYVLSKDLVAPPGSRWNYSGGLTNVLGQVVRRAAGTGVFEFADEVLLGPLGITDRTWPRFRNGMEYVSGDLTITPRAMAKIGHLFAYGGQWQGRQVVSQRWIDEASSRQARDAVSVSRWIPGADGYGYQWWTTTYRGPFGPVDAFFASGWGGNHIIVVRDPGLVVVFTGASYTDSPVPRMTRIVERHVLAALNAP